MKAKMTNLLHSKLFRIIVCFALGNYGIHRFLMKRWISGSIMLLLTLLGGSGVTTLWGFIDIILIATGRLTEKQKKQYMHAGTADDPIIL